MHDDFDRCYRAVQSKDERFDGWFVTAVLTTGIYCRPSCPARPPHARNLRFYPTAAAAQQGGFRACKRCRPDATPGSPAWHVRQDVVARAMRMIADGVVDREGVAGLATRLGYSQRQVERHLLAEVGAGPLALARAQRAQTARVLIETTPLPFAHVAFGAGFASIRQFNDTVREVFAMTPTELRMKARHRDRGTAGGVGGVGGGGAPVAAPVGITVRLPFRRPFCPDNLFGHLAATAIPGCEEHDGDTYRRTLQLPNGTGIVSLAARDDHIAAHIVVDDLRDLTAAIARSRRLLDLDADPEAVDEALRNDPFLEPLVDKAPGRRVPRTVDPHELAVRAVLGQQISTAAARTHAARLVARHGSPLAHQSGSLTHAFPTAAELVDLDPMTLSMPASRRDSILALVRALADGRIDLDVSADWGRARTQLAELPGIGPWTVEVIAMRALGDPDAFPVTDMGVRKASQHLGIASSAAALAGHAEHWAPWRAYATQYLWASLDHPINTWQPMGAA